MLAGMSHEDDDEECDDGDELDEGDDVSGCLSAGCPLSKAP